MSTLRIVASQASGTGFLLSFSALRQGCVLGVAFIFFGSDNLATGKPRAVAEVPMSEAAASGRSLPAEDGLGGTCGSKTINCSRCLLPFCVQKGPSGTPLYPSHRPSPHAAPRQATGAQGPSTSSAFACPSPWQRLPVLP